MISSYDSSQFFHHHLWPKDFECGYKYNSDLFSSLYYRQLEPQNRVWENDDEVEFGDKVVVVADGGIHLMMLLIKCQLSYKLFHQRFHRFHCEIILDKKFSVK